MALVHSQKELLGRLPPSRGQKSSYPRRTGVETWGGSGLCHILPRAKGDREFSNENHERR